MYLSMAMTQVTVDMLDETWLLALDFLHLSQLADAVVPPLLTDHVANSF